jgi:limonene-1,2-epoxide hydrolase
MSGRDDLLTLVSALEDAANRHAIDEVMAMLTDDVAFELEGMARLVGKQEVRSVFEYDAGIHGEIHLINCTAEGNGVSCQLVESNDRLREAGLDTLLYPSCLLSFTNQRIRAWRAVPDPEAARTFERFWVEVRLWIADNCPADYARIFSSDGRFIRNRSNGERVVQLARQYRSARMA